MKVAEHMKKGFDIMGSVTFYVIGGLITEKFTQIDMSPVTGDGRLRIYSVDIRRPDYSGSYLLDADLEMNGITLEGKKYFGKDINSLFIALGNLKTEKTLEILD